MENNELKEPVHTQPTRTVVKEKMKSRPAVVILSVLFIAAVAGLGLTGYSLFQSRQQVTDLQNELKLTKETLAAANAPRIAEAAGEKEAAISDKGQRSSAERAARLFFCETANSPCDTSSATITKIRLADVSKAPYIPGFATVTVSTPSGGAAKYYVKSTDGLEWVVIYDGQNVPPAEIVEKFAIPSDFAG